MEKARFLFTIYENQRWWMGLDWTAALLPGERPSWGSAAQAPLPPPSSFALPEPAVAYLPGPGGKGRLKRMAIWSWEEKEWRVSVRREGESGSVRVERPIPEETDGGSGARLFKGVGKIMEAGAASDKDKEKEKKDAGDGSGAEDTRADEDVYTDPDGWVYGDNKWEARSAKGGMGKVCLASSVHWGCPMF